jgi:hypothetical protein
MEGGADANALPFWLQQNRMTTIEGVFSMGYQFLDRFDLGARTGVAVLAALGFLLPAGAANAACGAEGAELIKNLNGAWHGNGSMTPIGGEKAQITCRVQYKAQGDRVSQTVSCKGGELDISATSDVNCEGTSVEGSWTESIANNTGSVRGSIGANKMDVDVESPSFKGRFAVRFAGSSHTVTITEMDPAMGRHVPVATMSLSR